MQTTNDITMVTPALAKYAQGPLADLWKRPGLTPRDRSIVTISALIARNQTIEMPYYFNLALDNGRWLTTPQLPPCPAYVLPARATTTWRVYWPSPCEMNF